MTPFYNDLIVAEDNGCFTLTSPLLYRGKRDTFRVPPGFCTDFASTPRVLWAFFPPYGEHTKAAVLHDYLYRLRPLVVAPHQHCYETPTIPITRRDADGIFLRVMEELNTPAWRRYLMWLMVRIFGGFAWRHARLVQDGA